MKFFLILFALTTCLFLAKDSAQAESTNGVCWKTTPCSGAHPCVYVRQQPFTCGTDCVVMDGSGQRGAPGCNLSIEGNCLKATLVQPGCCVTPCPPPGENCPVS